MMRLPAVTLTQIFLPVDGSCVFSSCRLVFRAVNEWMCISFSRRKGMTVTLTQFIIWVIIAAIVGFLGELISGRRAPAGILGAIMIGLFAIFLIVGFFHFSIAGEPTLDGIPIISTIIAAAILVVIWSSLVYRRR
jgi:uncharacterized membrane protein YeaQ/YmgE (transglycosylase-associated protein family)